MKSQPSVGSTARSCRYCRRPTRIGAVVAVAIMAMFYLLPISGSAQTGGAPGQDVVVDAGWKINVIERVLTTLDTTYVFPDVAKKMVDQVRKQQKAGVYKDLTTAFAFTEQLTADLLEISHDKHLGVRYAPDLQASDTLPDSLLSDEERQRRLDEQLQELRFANFGFIKLERLAGNIGYVDFRQFADARWGGPTAIAAMNFLANSDAVIIDLRQNGGGEPSMIQLISSYFFDTPTHLNDIHSRGGKTVDQYWTQAHVDGQRMAKTDLYILTSSYTFSAAEEFTYNMKNLKRAVIIGETTGGGAHPVADFVFADLRVLLRVPNARSVNPISGTNWEGTGVTPDIAVPQDQALDRAYVEALRKLRERAPEGPVKDKYTWAIETREAWLNPASVPTELQQKYAGLYGPRTIIFENGELYYQREGRPKYRMIPMSQDTFVLKDMASFRIKFGIDAAGKVTEIIGQYDDGRIDRSPRNPGQ